MPLNDITYDLPVKNCLQNARILGNNRKTKWFYKMASKGFFTGVSKNDQEQVLSFARQIDSMITVLNGVYPDNWDFDFEQTLSEDAKSLKILVVIRFPEINLVNSLNKRHFIKDLFVVFELKPRTGEEGEFYMSFNNIKGTRSTVSYEEYQSRYMHSHLGGVKVDSYNEAFRLKNFCIGEGNGTDLQHVRDSLFLEYDENMFELFLYNIRTLVEWESLEGKPHRYISDITITGNAQYAAYRFASTSNLDEFYSNFRDVITSLPLDFVFLNNKYRIIRNHKLNNFVKKMIVEYIPHYKEDYLVIKIPEHNKYKKYHDVEIDNNPNEKIKNENGEIPTYLFRGNFIKYKIEKYDGRGPNIDAYKVHPEIINHVAKRLENEIYEKKVREYTIRRQHQSHNGQVHIR